MGDRDFGQSEYFVDCLKGWTNADDTAAYQKTTKAACYPPEIYAFASMPSKEGGLY